MIINLDRNVSIIVSAAVALLYTCFGKMVSVAYTDVFQLLLVAFGMVSYPAGRKGVFITHIV